MSITDTLRHQYALSQQGARDLVKSCLASACMDIVLMLPVGLLFFLVKDLMEGNELNIWGYVWKIAFCLLAIAAMEFFKYNKQFTTVYLESGRRRIALAEKLRRLPLSFFGKKDLADPSRRYSLEEDAGMAEDDIAREGVAEDDHSGESCSDDDTGIQE